MPAYQDPIVAEVRRIRTEIAEKHNNDFFAYSRSLKSKRPYLEKSGWKFKSGISV